MSNCPTRIRGLLGLLIVIVGAALVGWLYGRPEVPTDITPASGPADPFPVPPYSESLYRNTGPDAQYVGTAACIGCHAANHRSYLLTAHSRALGEVDPAAEPPDGSFDHFASGRTYQVDRRDGKFRHAEVVRDGDGKEVARVDVPVRYLVGSGHHTRSYLIEVDGFLHESPITWYVSKGRWDMSPGYDAASHWGFERPVTAGCLACHAGRAEAAGTVNRLTLLETTIGCESCHGPGSEHLARHQSGPRWPAGEADPTIVNPARLSRAGLEAVCAACHQRGVATVPLRGRQAGEYRPGRPLTDYRVEYDLEGAGDQMTVVGHVEQLRRSPCYQKSANLTCVTCHDPHARDRPADPVAFYRQKCLECHANRGCSVPMVERRARDPADNCAACHMPRGDTDLPHIAFTHHRIGRHPVKPTVISRSAPELVPTDDVSRLPDIDRRRNLGLAYWQVAQEPRYARYAESFAEQARMLLDGVQAAGLRDGFAAAALADIYASRDPGRSQEHARQAVNAPDTPPSARAAALLRLAEAEVRAANPDAAVGMLEELVRLRRCSADWWLLGSCRLLQDRPKEALPALQQALAIRPDLPQIHLVLAEAYRRLGDGRLAREHQEKGDWLSRHNPRPAARRPGVVP